MSHRLELEKVIKDNIDVSKLGLKLIGREYRTTLGIIDILCQDGNMRVPIEVKVGTASDSAIGQILGYMEVINAEYGIIMADNFTKRVKIVANKLNIKLIPYTIDVIIGDESIVYDKVKDGLFNGFENLPAPLCDDNQNFYELNLFVEENIVYTGENKYYIKQLELYDEYIEWYNYNKNLNNIIGVAFSTRIFHRLFRKKFNTDAIPITVDGKTFRVYKGIKYLN